MWFPFKLSKQKLSPGIPDEDLFFLYQKANERQWDVRQHEKVCKGIDRYYLARGGSK